jgi:hypothetical protein
LSDAPQNFRQRESPPTATHSIWFQPDRPKIVAMLGFLCLAIGYVGFVMKGAQLPSLFSDMKWLNPDYKPIPYNRVQYSIAALLLLSSMLLSLIAIAGAIGTLKLRHWGRRTLIWYAIIGAMYTLAKTGWQISMFDFMLDFQLSTTTQPLFDRETMANRQFFALIVMTGIQLAWSAGIVLLLTNRYIMSRFDTAEGASGGDWQSSKL